MEVLKLHTPLTTLEDAVAMAKDWYSNHTGELIPTMLSYSKTEGMILALPDVGDREHGGREQSLQFAKMFNTIFDVKIYCLLTESYVLKQGKEVDMSKWVGRIKDHPDAVEKLIILVCSDDRRMISYFDITKDRKLENEERSEGIEGEFAELGAIKEVPSEVRSYLKAKFIQDFKVSPTPNA